MKEKKKTSIKISIISVIAIPILLLLLVLIFVCRRSVTEGMELEIKDDLASCARNTVDIISLAYPGEIQCKGDAFYIGGVDLTNDFTIVNHIKENTGNDITIFYGSKRMLTTLVGADGKELVNTEIDDQNIINTISMGNEYYSNCVKIDGQKYYGYYVPLYNGKTVCGMVFAGVSNDSVKTEERTIVTKILIVFGLALFLILFISTFYANGLVKRLRAIADYMDGLAESNTNNSVLKDVFEKNDEIADMGRDAEEIGKRLNALIYNDPLTTLFNRRAGRMEIEKSIDEAEMKNARKVTIALGDIDFFKKVNDQYGHDMGDEVLKKVSAIMKAHVGKQGAPIRWGGEEFLIVLNRDLDTSLEILNSMLDEIRATEFYAGEKTFKTTMTFGVTPYHNKETMDEIVKRADELLYEGKTNGRNQIVVDKSY